MTFQASVRGRNFNREERLAYLDPYSLFPDLYHNQRPLYALQGYNPIHVQAAIVQSNIANPLLKVEVAQLEQPLKYKGAEVTVVELRGYGGKILSFPTNTGESESAIIVGLNWASSGIVLEGNPATISGNKLTLSGANGGGGLNFKIRSDAAKILQNPLLRVRRAYATEVSAENVGTGDTSTKEFNHTLSGKPIAPGSIKIDFTSSGSKSIRDNGKGKFYSVAPEVVLDTQTHSTVNYETGEIFLSFHDDHLPNGAITADYEHQGTVDRTVYDFLWENAEFPS